MTTTKALAKLHKVIVGTDGKNSIAKNLESLAANWASKVPSASEVANAVAIPDLPTLAANGTKYYVLKVVKSNEGITYTWDEKTFT